MAFPDGWTKRWPININADSVTTGLVSDWPCLVTDQHFPAAAWANLQATGADLRFSSDEAGLTELYYDTPRLDVAGQKAHLYVRVPSLLASEDTVIYGWCGNATATAPSAAWMQNTYHADIVAWWPMEEGDGATVADRTNNGYDGALNHANPDAAWGIANGLHYVAMDGDRIECSGPGNSLSDTTDMVVFRVPSTATDQGLLHTYNNSVRSREHIIVDASGKIRFGSPYPASGNESVGIISTGDAWQFVVCSWNQADGDATFHMDGAFDSVQAGGFGGAYTDASVRFGIAEESKYPLTGDIAWAARVYDVLTTDEIACHHLMLSDPATWATAGALVDVGGGGVPWPVLMSGQVRSL